MSNIEALEDFWRPERPYNDILKMAIVMAAKVSSHRHDDVSAYLQKDAYVTHNHPQVPTFQQQKSAMIFFANFHTFAPTSLSVINGAITPISRGLTWYNHIYNC